MASKIKVDQIEGSSGSTITIPTGQTLTVTDGISATNLSGTIADARLPTVPVSKGGTGLTSLGTAGQVVKVNSGASALEFGTLSSDFVKIKTIDADNVSSLAMVHGSNDVVFDGTYEQYHIKIMNFYHYSGSASELQLRITTNSGSSYNSSGYNQQRFRSYYSGNTDDYSQMSDSIWRWHFGGDVGANATRQQADIWLSKPTINAYPDARGFFWGAETSQALLGIARGRYQTQTTYNGFQFTQTNGANFSGKFVLYGIKA